jgi:hypothetical protein
VVEPHEGFAAILFLLLVHDALIDIHALSLGRIGTLVHGYRRQAWQYRYAPLRSTNLSDDLSRWQGHE